MAQTAGSSTAVDRLTNELEQTRSQLQESQRQIEALRHDLEELRAQVQGQSGTPAAAPSTSADPPPTTDEADKDPSFIAAEVTELHQDKVESGSKYPVKLSGLVLFNAYRNRGNFDINDLPNLAFPRYDGGAGSVGATLRQTILGVEASGPDLMGSRTSADVSIDFAGGSPTSPYGITTGLLRMRTANVHLDWRNTSLTIGQDSPFFSPLSPTSYASVAEPGLSWAGNLWVWTPQVTLEHRISAGEGSHFALQAGILDPLTEEIPPLEGRQSTAGESTRLPAIAGHIAYDRLAAGSLPLEIGFGGYRGEQRYENFPQIDSWTFNSDYKLRMGSHVELSGEWYHGQAAGGLGGGIWTSVIYPDAAHSGIHPLHSTGGWTQLKVRPAPRFEINTAVGQDENRGADLRFFASPVDSFGYAPLEKNRAGFVNVIFRPNSVLLFAVEERHLFTAPASGTAASGDHLNIAAGVRF